jgi:hypothetical protein
LKKEAKTFAAGVRPVGARRTTQQQKFFGSFFQKRTTSLLST